MAHAFISYSHADEHTVKRLLTHMSQLKRDGLLNAWYDEEILSGDKLGESINEELEKADLFLAIISADYLNSGYCFDIEFKHALEKFHQGNMRIVPIIAQPCDWQHSPFKDFKAIPRDGKAISEFTSESNALLNVISELRRLVSASPLQKSPIQQNNSAPVRTYKIKQDFDAVDLLNFRDESFADIYRFFKEAVEEINGVDQIKARFVSEQVGQSFTCVITNRSKINTTGYISVGIHQGHDHFGGRNGIAFTLAEQLNPNVYGNSYSIEHSDYELYWIKHNPMHQQRESKAITAKEIAEQLWDAFIDQVGVNR
jgi:hypothetical protein